MHSDHLNTPRTLTNDSNQLVWQWTYSAFGEDSPTLAKYRFAVLDIAPNPGTTGTSELRFNPCYPGQYGDVASGLLYNYLRSYDVKTGRYTQPHPVGPDGGLNRFAYVDGDPLNCIDPLWFPYSWAVAARKPCGFRPSSISRTSHATRRPDSTWGFGKLFSRTNFSKVDSESATASRTAALSR